MLFLARHVALAAGLDINHDTTTSGTVYNISTHIIEIHNSVQLANGVMVVVNERKVALNASVGSRYSGLAWILSGG